MSKPRLALARGDDHRPVCALCGHHRPGIEIGSLPVSFICLVCVTALGRWLATISDEIARQIWRIESGQLAGTESIADGRQTVTSSRSNETSVEAILHDFKAGLEKVIRPHDADVHLDLGIAYREMGLGRDAVAEWGAVLRSPAGVQATRRAVQLIFAPPFLRDDGFELIRTNLYPA